MDEGTTQQTQAHRTDAERIAAMESTLAVFREALCGLQVDKANLRADLEVARGIAWICLQGSSEARYILGLHDESNFRQAMQMQALDAYQVERAVNLLIDTQARIQVHRTHSLPALLARLAHDTGLQFQRLCTPACWSWKTAVGVAVLSLATFYLAAFQ